MSVEDVALDLIPGIYDAALDPSQWESILMRLSDVMGGALVTFHIQEAKGRVRLWEGVRAAPDRTALFLNGRGYTEPTAQPMAALLAKPPATFITRETVLSDADYCRSAIYNDIIRPDGLWHWGFSAVARNADFAAIFGLVRKRRSGAYDNRELSLLALLMPHLQRAAQISFRFNMLEKGTKEFAFGLLETLSVGVAIVAAAGRLLYANKIAEKVLREGDALSVSQYRLCARAAVDAQDFARMIREAAQTSAGNGTATGGVLHLHRSDGTTLPVLVCPLRTTANVGPMPLAAAVVFADCGAKAAISCRALTERWRLTRAEARLLAALAAGQDLETYARTAGIGIGTVRTHLKQIFAKTGHHRQIDVVRAVLSDPLVRLASSELSGTGLKT